MWHLFFCIGYNILSIHLSGSWESDGYSREETTDFGERFPVTLMLWCDILLSSYSLHIITQCDMLRLRRFLSYTADHHHRPPVHNDHSWLSAILPYLSICCQDEYIHHNQQTVVGNTATLSTCVRVCVIIMLIYFSCKPIHLLENL